MSGQVDTLRDAARDLQRVAATLADPVARVRGRLQDQSVWSGPAADRFRAAVDGADREVRRLQQDLVAHAAALLREADETERRTRLG